MLLQLNLDNKHGRIAFQCKLLKFGEPNRAIKEIFFVVIIFGKWLHSRYATYKHIQKTLQEQKMCQVVTYLKMLPTVFFYVISLTFHIACLNRLSNFTCYSKVKDNSSRYFGILTQTITFTTPTFVQSSNIHTSLKCN